MEKRFCDICEKPAIKIIEYKYGSHNKTLNNEAIVLSLDFIIKSSLSRRMPDLCEECLNVLLREFAENILERTVIFPKV